jgi:hypothetical protein|tara:strand:- start:228 stop:347 length:120 start_codon:yes stop_codon:yes gene_type:complete
MIKIKDMIMEKWNGLNKKGKMFVAFVGLVILLAIIKGAM